MLARGGVPVLGELRLHNGTIYRWNRPVYDIYNCKPHLRLENRVLPAGPTVTDMIANIAFSLGLTHSLANDQSPIWMRLPFSCAEDNFITAARDGLDARVFWPGRGEIAIVRLVLDTLLPLAQAGLSDLGVDSAVRDRFLKIIEDRCLTRQNGATWQTAVVSALEDHRNLDRTHALRRMFDRYQEGSCGNEPIHLWPVD